MPFGLGIAGPARGAERRSLGVNDVVTREDTRATKMMMERRTVDGLMFLIVGCRFWISGMDSPGGGATILCENNQSEPPSYLLKLRWP